MLQRECLGWLTQCVLTFYGDSLNVRQAENPVAQWSPSVPEGLEDSWESLWSSVYGLQPRKQSSSVNAGWHLSLVWG